MMHRVRGGSIAAGLYLTLAVAALGLGAASAAEPARDPNADATPRGQKPGAAPRPSPGQPTARPNPQPQPPAPSARPAPTPRQPVVQPPQPQPQPQARTPRGDDRRNADRSDRGGDFRAGRPPEQRRGDFGRDRNFDDRRGYRPDRGRDDDRYARRRNFGLGAGAIIIGGIIGYEIYRGNDRDRIFDRCDRNFPDFDYETGSFVNEDGEREICPYLAD